MPNSVITDALSRARLGSCCRTPPGTPMHRRCGCDLSAMTPPHGCRRLMTAAVSTTTRSTLPSPPATSGSTHKLRIQASGGTSTPAAAQHVGTVASVDVPPPVSDPVPTVDPSQLRADLLRGEFTTSRAARAARAERHHRPTGTLSCRAIVVHRRLDGLVHAAVLQRPFPVEPTVIVDEPSIVEAGAGGVAVGRDVHGTTVATGRWQRSPPIGGCGR